jgi:hypothetical protein
MNYIMNLDIVMGFEIIKTAYKKKDEERLWERWLVEYPLLEEFMSFEDYKDKTFGTTVKVDKEQALKDAELIKQADQNTS